MERKKARTAGRSDLARRALTVEVRDDISIILETSNRRPSISLLERYANRLHNFAQNIFGGFRFLLQRSVARAGHYAVGKDGHGELLEIIRQAEVAPFKKCPRLSGALQHERATRADSQCELIGFARAVHYLQRVIMQA